MTPRFAAATLLGLTLLVRSSHGAAPSAPPAYSGAPVTVSGMVADEASRATILTKLRAVYGETRVIDELEVGNVVPPPNWTADVTRLIGPELRLVRRGQIHISGTQVSLRGELANEARRQQLASSAAQALTPAYVVTNALTLAPDAQAVLDHTLADRVIEFDSGAATLTATGVEILDEMAGRIEALEVRKLQIIGHTDSHGNRLANVGLSLARANAVRDYLLARGIAGERLSALGAGPDRPVADNDTPAGRARNRRIEFRIVE